MVLYRDARRPQFRWCCIAVLEGRSSNCVLYRGARKAKVLTVLCHSAIRGRSSDDAVLRCYKGAVH